MHIRFYCVVGLVADAAVLLLHAPPPQVCYIENADPSLCGLATTTLVATLSPLALIVSGGNALAGEGAAVLLDASRSYDPDGSGPPPAASSSQPVDPSLVFSWDCAPAVGSGPCRSAATGLPVVLPQGASASRGASAALSLQGSAGSGANYTIGVNVSKADGRFSRRVVWLVVRTGTKTPVISIVPPAAAPVDPGSKVAVIASVTPSDPQFAYSVATSWSLVVPPAVPAGQPPFSLAAAAAVPLNSTSLVLRPNTLPPRTTIVLRLTATDDGSTQSAIADVTLAVAGAPTGGSVSVTPARGYGLETQFTFSASGWCAPRHRALSFFRKRLRFSSNTMLWGKMSYHILLRHVESPLIHRRSDPLSPLQYSFAYSFTGDFNDAVAIAGFGPASSIKMLLPAPSPPPTSGGSRRRRDLLQGDASAPSASSVSVFVSVRNAAGVVATSAPVAVSVSWSPSAASSDEAVLDRVAATAGQIREQILLGHPESVVGLVAGAADLLGSLSSGTGGTASGGGAPLKAEAVREELLLFLSEAALLSQPTTGLYRAVSAAAAAVLSAPEQLTPEAQAAGLNLLTVIAEGRELVSDPVANSTTSGLCSLAKAAQRGSGGAARLGPAGARHRRALRRRSRGLLQQDGAATSSNLLGVTSAMDALSSSLVGGMVVPGEAASVQSSACIQMVTRLDSLGKASRLVKDSIRSPNAASVAEFSPLPAEWLSGLTTGGAGAPPPPPSGGGAAGGAAVAPPQGGVQVQFLDLTFKCVTGGNARQCISMGALQLLG